MSDSYLKDSEILTQIDRESTGRKLFERIGGRPTLTRVHKLFYDRIYSHPWLGKFFAGVDQTIIETQQSDFMAQLMGGPRMYSGRMPIDAHMHMYITEELFQVRRDLLIESLKEAGVPEAEQTDWLRLDAAFKKVIIKDSVEDCKRRYTTDEILAFAPPKNFGKAS